MTHARDGAPLASIQRASGLPPERTRWQASAWRLPRLSAPIRWAMAPFATLLVALLQLALLPDPSIAPFPFFFVAVALTSLLCGHLQGLLTVGLSAAVANYLLLEPYAALALSGPALTATALYVGAASTVALLCSSFRWALLDMQRLHSVQRAAKEALRESEERFRTLADAIPQLAWVAEADGNIYWYNQRWYQYTGTTLDQMEGWGWQSLHDPAVLPAVLERWRASLSSGEAFEMEFPLRGADGKFRRFLTRVVPLKGADGRVVRWFGTNTDITGMTEAQAALRSERDFTSAVLDTAGSLVVVFDRERRITRFNRACERLSGYPATEAQGRTFDFLIPPEQLPQVQEVWDALLKGRFPSTHENEWVCKDAKRRLIEWTNTSILGPHGEVQHVIGTGVDITERNQAEVALRASEERFRALANASSEVIYCMSPDWSEMRQLRSHGFLANTEHPNANWLDEYIHADDQPQVTAAITEAIRTKSVFQFEHRVRRADESLGWTLSRAVPVRDENGDIIEWFGAASDITARKHAEEELRRSEATLNAFFEASPGTLSILDDELRYIKCDSTTPGYFGLTRENIVGKSAGELAPEFAAHLGALLREVVTSGAPKRDQEMRFTAPGGAGRVAIWRASYFPVPLSEGRYGLGVMGVEITDLKEAEAAREGFVQALRDEDRRKTEFLAVLSHELRNPLAPIRNSLYILDRAAPGGDQARRAQAVISRQADQLARLVDDLLDVTRLTKNKVELLSLAGDEVEVAYSGSEGLKKAGESRPDVVFCDIGLPGMDGYTVASALRADERLKRIYIVALTGYALPEDLTKARGAGFDRHIAKPPTMEKIEAALAAASMLPVGADSNAS